MLRPLPKSQSDQSLRDPTFCHARLLKHDLQQLSYLRYYIYQIYTEISYNICIFNEKNKDVVVVVVDIIYQELPCLMTSSFSEMIKKPYASLRFYSHQI